GGVAGAGGSSNGGAGGTSNGGTSGTGTGGGAGGGANQDGGTSGPRADASDDSGCGCSLPGQSSRSSLLALFVLALVVARRVRAKAAA
ncbi:MAG TPA: MYXO-CTERM sorting domain-containing protein, partial [Polyangiaceae bacterium]|nr:MYXO-CTERM sorting domain-containing protein [Polyangiaceae bacterium]